MLSHEAFQIMFCILVYVATVDRTFDERCRFTPVTRQMGGFSFNFFLGKFLESICEFGLKLLHMRQAIRYEKSQCARKMD